MNNRGKHQLMNRGTICCLVCNLLSCMLIVPIFMWSVNEFQSQTFDLEMDFSRGGVSEGCKTPNCFFWALKKGKKWHNMA